jgi:hypothetical protein
VYLSELGLFICEDWDTSNVRVNITQIVILENADEDGFITHTHANATVALFDLALRNRFCSQCQANIAAMAAAGIDLGTITVVPFRQLPVECGWYIFWLFVGRVKAIIIRIC